MNTAVLFVGFLTLFSLSILSSIIKEKEAVWPLGAASFVLLWIFLASINSSV